MAWRTNEPDFVLNQPQYAGASILVAGPDFGTGSSREHAVLGAAGRRLPGGHQLPVRRHLPQQLDQGRAAHRRCCRRRDVEALWAAVEADPATAGDGRPAGRAGHATATSTVPFEIDDYTRWRLLEGLDDVGLTERNLRRHRGVRGHPAGLAAARRCPRRSSCRGVRVGVEVPVVVRAQRTRPAAQHPDAALGRRRVEPPGDALPAHAERRAAPTGSRRPGCRRR